MLIRRSAILALSLAIAGLLLGQSIEPHRAYGGHGVSGERVRSLHSPRGFGQQGNSVRVHDRLFVARFG